MAKTQWLQCTIPMENWQKLNERRLNLGLTWSALLEPAANGYLTKLEADKAQVKQQTEASPKAIKGANKKATTGKKKQGKAPTTKAPEKTDSKETKAQSGEEKAPAVSEEVK